MTREDAIKELKILKEEYWDDDGYGHETKQYDDTMFALDMAIKALEQESKIGHWIVNKEKSLARCSNCKFLLKNKDEIKLFGTFIQGYNYCPYCGAKMVEPQESKTKQGLAYADQDTLMSAT